MFSRKKEEQPPRSHSVITSVKAAFGYEDVGEEILPAEPSPGTPSPGTNKTTGKGGVSNVSSKYGSTNASASTEYGGTQDGGRSSQKPRGSNTGDVIMISAGDKIDKHLPAGDRQTTSRMEAKPQTRSESTGGRPSAGQRMSPNLGMLSSKRETLPCRLNTQDSEFHVVPEDEADEFEVLNALSHISGAVKNPEQALKCLQDCRPKRAGQGSAVQKNKASPQSFPRIKYAFLFLVGSNELPAYLRVPWYLRVMQSTMVLSLGTKVALNLQSGSTKAGTSTKGNTDQALTFLTIKEITQFWNAYLSPVQINSLVPKKIGDRLQEFTTENKVKLRNAHDDIKLVSFYKILAVIVFGIVKESFKALKSVHTHIKDDILVDFAGNQVTDEIGVFEGIWTEVTRLMHIDRLICLESKDIHYSDTTHAGAICFNYILKMTDNPKLKKYSQLLHSKPDYRQEIYKAIGELQLTFFLWEDTVKANPNMKHYMFDLFVLLQGKAIPYLLAKIVTSNLESLEYWIQIKQLKIKLISSCRELMTSPNAAERVVQLLDSDFINKEILQLGSK